MTMRDAIHIADVEAKKHCGIVRTALDIVIGNAKCHLARRDRKAEKRANVAGMKDKSVKAGGRVAEA